MSIKIKENSEYKHLTKKFGVIQIYYDNGAEILRRYQVLGHSAHTDRSGVELFASIKTAVQR